MSINPRLAELLEQRPAPYEVMPHTEAFTAQEVAQRTHVPGHQLAKVVVVCDDTCRYLMAVLPASDHLDLHVLRHVTGRTGLTLADEIEIARLFPDCEQGAMPPFGHLYGIPMFVDPCLAGDEVFFQAGNHHEVVRMRWNDYERLASPFIGDSCLHGELIHLRR